MDHRDLKAQRKRLGYSRLSLSEESRVSQFRLYLHERGTIKLTDDELRRIRATFERRAQRIRKELDQLEGMSA